MRGVPDRSVIVRPIPIEQLDLSSKRMAVIGGTNGLGRAIAAQALARGAEVTVVGRTFRDDPAARLTFSATKPNRSCRLEASTAPTSIAT